MIRDLARANLYTYIDQIRTRPGMYIGGHSVTLLFQHIAGYDAACFWKGIDELLDPKWEDFHDFVAVRTGFADSTSGWANMLLSYCGGDEAKALAKFFETFDAFRQGTGC